MCEGQSQKLSGQPLIQLYIDACKSECSVKPFYLYIIIKTSLLTSFIDCNNHKLVINIIMVIIMGILEK